MSYKLEEILTRFRAEIPNFVATGVCEIESGLELIGITADPNFVIAVAAPTFSDVAKQSLNGLDVLGIGGETCEDILITMTAGMVLLRILKGEYYFGLAMGPQTPLGFARAMMKKYEPQLIEAVNEIKQM
jgi:hypothetical protein